MKNISFSTKSRKRRYSSEIIETEAYDWQSASHLPRHICVPETRSHRDRHNPSRINYAPRACQLEAEGQEQVNLAVNILKYQLGDNTFRQKHSENILHNLKYRLQIAKSQGNNQLLDILQDEYQQLETSI